MVSLPELRALRPSEFEDAADGWHRLSTAASAAEDRVENEIAAGLRKSMEGDGVDAAVTRLRRLGENFHYIQVETGLVRAALNGLAAEMRTAQKKLEDAVADAEADRMTVGDDGSVHYVTDQVPLAPNQSVPPGGPALLVPAPADPAASDPARARAQGYADRIAAALAEAGEVDARYARALARLHADNDLDVSDSDWTDAQGDTGAVRTAAGRHLALDDIPAGKSPLDNAEWWRRLSEDERADYATLFPAAVGALDGLPADVRDEANRTVLAEKRADYQQQLDGIPPEPAKYTRGGAGYPYATKSAEWIAWNEEYGDRKEHLEGALRGMKAIEDRFASTGVGGLPPAYLLGFDPEGDGRAIVANGNPDTADHTAVYVPGTGAGLAKAQGDLNRAADLWRTSEAMADGSSVSTITWIGYDAPDDVAKDAPFSHYADDGAPAFNRFIDGLNTSSDLGAGVHTSVIAHSYGSTLVGSAARQGDLDVDDVAFAGSPGVQVGRASDMDVPEGHVWNQEARGDMVPDLGRLGHGHREWHWSSGVDFVIPSDDRFGAFQMGTDGEGHSSYFDYDDAAGPSESLANQARVVTGNYGDITRQGPYYDDAGD